MDRWAGRVSVVTGASEGIGAAIVRRLAARGMKVAALARRKELLDEIERDVNKAGKGQVKGLTCDVTSKSDVVSVFKKIEAEMGPVSVLVNNAGLLRTVILSDTLDLDSAQSLLDTNVMGVLNCVRETVGSMKRANITDGHIVNISSMAAHMDTEGFPEYSIYAATKTALNVLTKSIKYQLKKEKLNTRVTTVSPGLVETTMTAAVITEFSRVPRLQPDDVAQIVEFVIATPNHVNINEVTLEPSKAASSR